MAEFIQYGEYVNNMLISINSKLDAQKSIWDKCLNTIEDKVDTLCYNAWFRSTKLLNPDSKNLIIETANAFAADYIEENFSDLIEYALNKESIRFESISFTASETVLEILPDNDEIDELDRGVTTLSASNLPAQPKKVPKKLTGSFRADYTLDNFIVGESNQFAHTSCLAVAEAPGQTCFNPLFIHGDTGLGKTHLLQAVGHFIHNEGTANNVLYLSGKDFIDQYMEHIKSQGNSIAFSSKFADIDVLLIDDIHFLRGKTSTQKEFQRIFNNLLLQKKQIILTSDRHPEKIQDMMDHLINRFLGGLVIDIQPPKFETRMEILRAKASSDGIHLPEEVVQYIAGHVTENVRELEGTLIKLIASASFTGTEINMESCSRIFGDVISRQNQRLTITSVQKAVADYFSITINQLRAHTRKRSITYPRNIAMYLCKELLKQSRKTIGLDFGGRDYSTVIYACKKVEKELQSNTDTELKKHISDITATLKHLSS